VSQIRIRVCGLLVREEKLLLVRHEKAGRAYFLLPGGGVGAQETIPYSLKREFEEELGMSIQIGPIIFMAQSVSSKENRNILHLVFKIESEDEPTQTGKDPRVTGFQWHPLNSAEAVPFYPNILPRILELARNPSYNGMRLELPDWLD
jgi:8-oxo-dGTP diphosphatase